MSDAKFHLVARASILASGATDDFGYVASDEVVLVSAEALEQARRERDEALEAYDDEERGSLLLAGQVVANEKERDALRAEVERVEAEAASYRRVLVAVRDAMRATDQEPDGEDDPRRPLASLVWRVLKEKDAGAALLAEVERLRAERDEYRADIKNGMRIAWALTQETQTVEDMATDLVRQVREARQQRDEARADVARLREALTTVERTGAPGATIVAQRSSDEHSCSWCRGMVTPCPVVTAREALKGGGK